MTIPVLICDDSAMARKQVCRALPAALEAEVTYACNGLEGLEAIRAGRGGIVFLDLTMPELDGYQVLEAVRSEGLKALVIVISADIQPEARQRVLKLGALDFLRKPVDSEQLRQSLEGFGLF
jgi:CheY-like chemotaxis protein